MRGATVPRHGGRGGGAARRNADCGTRTLEHRTDATDFDDGRVGVLRREA
ncbi:hypothetical protein [Nocardia tengchongensis]